MEKCDRVSILLCAVCVLFVICVYEICIVNEESITKIVIMK